MHLAVEKAGLTTKHFSIFLSTCVSLSLSFFFCYNQNQFNTNNKSFTDSFYFLIKLYSKKQDMLVCKRTVGTV